MRPMFVALMFSLSLASVASAAPSRDVDAVKALELQRFEAATKNDLDKLAALLADDLVYTHSSGVVDSKATFLGTLRSGKTKYQTIEPSDMQVRVYGTTAVITAHAKIAILSDGQPKSIAVRYTDVWVKRAGKWQMVAWQSTKLP